MKTSQPKIALIAILSLGLPLLSHAEVSVSLTNNDASGTSSFNSKGVWNSATAPGPGTNYFTATSVVFFHEPMLAPTA